MYNYVGKKNTKNYYFLYLKFSAAVNINFIRVFRATRGKLDEGRFFVLNFNYVIQYIIAKKKLEENVKKINFLICLTMRQTQNTN